ncbi:MAG: hypothetical protein AAB545_00050 [Patescibacteria group bacterium]
MNRSFYKFTAQFLGIVFFGLILLSIASFFLQKQEGMWAKVPAFIKNAINQDE